MTEGPSGSVAFVVAWPRRDKFYFNRKYQALLGKHQNYDWNHSPRRLATHIFSFHQMESRLSSGEFGQLTTIWPIIRAFWFFALG